MDNLGLPHADQADNSDNDIDEDLWASPSTHSKRGKESQGDNTRAGIDDGGTLFEREEARQAALREELSC
ncbi:MAG: hypothetical protein Q9227_003489, partial [Pyrenula ochraceoflavens]